MDKTGATPDSPASLDFEPRVSVAVLTGDARALANKYYPWVKQEMLAEINQVVDTKLQAFMANYPHVAPDVTDELQQGWLKDNYVTYVSEVVERFMKATWIFSPAVSLDALHGEAKSRAQKLYESVDEAA